MINEKQLLFRCEGFETPRNEIATVFIKSPLLHHLLHEHAPICLFDFQDVDAWG